VASGSAWMSKRWLCGSPPPCCVEVLECWLWSLGWLGLRLMWGCGLGAGVDARASPLVCRVHRVALRFLDVGFCVSGDLIVDLCGA
jgi:hypothetical protein